MALMDNIPGWKVFSAGIGVAALALVGYFAYVWFIQGPDDLKELQNQAVEDALEQLAVKYAAKVREEGAQNVVVMPVRNETENGQVREMLISRLNDIEGIKADVPREPTLEERATTLVKSVVSDDEEQPDPNEVFENAGEADEVISVSVAKLWSGADSGICQLDVIRIIRDSGLERKASTLPLERIKGLSGSAKPGDEPTDDGPGFWSALGGILWRLIVVLAATAIMPFLSWPAAKAVFKQDSNGLNAALLFVLSMLDVLVLLLLVSFELSVTAIVCAVLLLPVSLIWNLRMLNFIEEQ